MALGELYNPKGLALETARAVLEVEHPLAVNVALGCPNGCLYCYGPNSMRTSRKKWCEMRFPKEASAKLVFEQLNKGKIPHGYFEGVFISFFTDCFHPLNRDNTEELIRVLQMRNHRVKIATSSKLGVSHENLNIRNGISLVSLDEKFQKTYEPNALKPKSRLLALTYAHAKDFTWVAMEPYPPSAIWKQDIIEFLEELAFWGTDLIVFGKWNYDKRASTEEAKSDYRDNIGVLTDFCKNNRIRLHIKSETLNFVNGSKG